MAPLTYAVQTKRGRSGLKKSCKVPKRAHLPKLQHLDINDALLQLLQLLLLCSLVTQQLQVLLAQLALGLLQGSPLSAQLLQP